MTRLPYRAARALTLAARLIAWIGRPGRSQVAAVLLLFVLLSFDYARELAPGLASTVEDVRHVVRRARRTRRRPREMARTREHGSLRAADDAGCGQPLPYFAAP